VITTTDEHPFWVVGLGWVEAEDLEVGMILQTSEETFVDIDGIERRLGEFEVYNFEVSEFHTYFVSDWGILVHNTCGDDPLPYKKPKTGGKAGATDVPSWVKQTGETPFVGESGNEFAKRVLDEKYGVNNYKKGAKTEFNQIKKWADRHFE
jgi:intein/homing endonuclease